MSESAAEAVSGARWTAMQAESLLGALGRETVRLKAVLEVAPPAVRAAAQQVANDVEQLTARAHALRRQIEQSGL